MRLISDKRHRGRWNQAEFSTANAFIQQEVPGKVQELHHDHPHILLGRNL
jgi:hypothetical protein